MIVELTLEGVKLCAERPALTLAVLVVRPYRSCLALAGCEEKSTRASQFYLRRLVGHERTARDDDALVGHELPKDDAVLEGDVRRPDTPKHDCITQDDVPSDDVTSHDVKSVSDVIRKRIFEGATGSLPPNVPIRMEPTKETLWTSKCVGEGDVTTPKHRTSNGPRSSEPDVLAVDGALDVERPVR